jgi:hypothetical protein
MNRSRDMNTNMTEHWRITVTDRGENSQNPTVRRLWLCTVDSPEARDAALAEYGEPGVPAYAHHIQSAEDVDRFYRWLHWAETPGDAVALG